jgi:D-aminopeptidase
VGRALGSALTSVRKPLMCNGIFIAKTDLTRRTADVIPVASQCAGKFEVGKGFDSNPVTWVETVAVKDGIDKYSAILKHPEVAQAEIREATAGALKGKAAKPYVLKPPIKIGVEWNSTTIAETCGLVPGVKRMSSRSTEYIANDWPDAMKVLLVELLLALEVSGGKGIYQ